MTPQEIFDLALTRVLKQGKPAWDAWGGCEYLKEDGSRCAVGQLLPVELAEVWASKRVGSIDDLMFSLRNDPVEVDYEVPYWVVDHHELLEQIQLAHDNSALVSYKYDPSFWREDFIRRMEGVARTFKLKSPCEPEHE
jgi:hypothetical protein